MNARFPVVARLLVAAGLLSAGVGTAGYGLVRLGFGRHGDFDLGFLHLGWMLEPSSPHWRAHVENLGVLVAGLALCAAAVAALPRRS